MYQLSLIFCNLRVFYRSILRGNMDDLQDSYTTLKTQAHFFVCGCNPSRKPMNRTAHTPYASVYCVRTEQSNHCARYRRYHCGERAGGIPWPENKGNFGSDEPTKLRRHFRSLAHNETTFSNERGVTNGTTRHQNQRYT